MPVDLDKKSIDIEGLARKVLKDGVLLAELLANLWSRNETVRYNSHKVLAFISEEHPETLYSGWDYLVKFLDSDNTYPGRKQESSWKDWIKPTTNFSKEVMLDLHYKIKELTH